MSDVIDAALDKHFGPLQLQPHQSFETPTSPQLAQQQEEEPLQQLISEKKEENTLESKQGIVSSAIKGLHSTIPGQTTIQIYGVITASNSLRTVSLSLAYTRFRKDLEATGQG